MRLAIAGLLLVLALGPSKAQDSGRDSEEVTVKQRLQAVREAQRKIEAERNAAEGERGRLRDRLREDELAIAAVLASIKALDERSADLAEEVSERNAMAVAIEARLSRQRGELAALLRLAYASGRNAPLRILFAPEDIGRIERALAYYRYLQTERLRRVRLLRADLEALTAARAAAQAAGAALSAGRAARLAEVAALEQARAARSQTLTLVQQQIAETGQRLSDLGRDERSLVELLQRLRNAIADVPRELAGSEPFGSLRGRLTWPVSGRMVAGFGDAVGGRFSEGIRIAAAPRAPVRAVSHGRVVFADWLAGYGLLVIIDHGDGYMSLYAHNESVQVEVGDWVQAGEPVAAVGSSGGRLQDGLYFELRSHGRPLDPVSWLTRR